MYLCFCFGGVFDGEDHANTAPGSAPAGVGDTAPVPSRLSGGHGADEFRRSSFTGGSVCPKLPRRGGVRGAGGGAAGSAPAAALPPDGGVGRGAGRGVPDLLLRQLHQDRPERRPLYAAGHSDAVQRRGAVQLHQRRAARAVLVGLRSAGGVGAAAGHLGRRPAPELEDSSARSGGAGAVRVAALLQHRQGGRDAGPVRHVRI